MGNREHKKPAFFLPLELFLIFKIYFLFLGLFVRNLESFFYIVFEKIVVNITKLAIFNLSKYTSHWP